MTVNWYRQAARHGDASALNNLGMMFENGRGIGRDSPEAYALFYIAASRGNTNASNNQDRLAKSLTPEQVAASRKRVSAWEALIGY